MDFEARYPFTAGAKRFLQDLHVESVTEEEIKNAEARVEAALHNQPVHEAGDTRATLVSYALARVLLASMSDEWCARQYAKWEADRAARRLRQENPTQKARAIVEFCPTATQTEDGWTVSVPDYARCGEELIIQDVENGQVHLDDEGLAALFQKAVENKVQDFANIDTKRLPPLLKQRALELRQRLPYPEKPASQYSGKYLDLECVRKIRDGALEGRRFYGTMALSIACVKDGLTQDQATEVIRDYVSKCPKGAQAYTPREAQQTLAWVFKHSGIGFSCKTMKEQGLLDRYCENCVSRTKNRTKTQAK